MPKNYNWKINREYYNLIINGKKNIEVRVGYPNIKKVKKGDTITFKDISNIKFEVIRVTKYRDFPDMLDNEDSSKAIPGVTKYKALDMYQTIYPEEKEALGVYVFELKKKENDIKFYKLSSLINNHLLFNKFASATCSVTDCYCTDYPNHFKWYWTKALPRVLNGTGEIIICIVNNNVAGVTILKKNGRERKICTLYVVEGYRKKHIATNMLEYAFKYLETTKPLITIADYKVPLFESLIKKYHWKLIQTMEEGYYNDFSREKVFNEHLYPD